MTGGARGIGRATAEEIGATAYELDVTSTESFSAFLDRVEADLGPLDVMINNAGILHLGPFLEEDEAGQMRQVDINLNGAMTGTKLVLRRMLPRERGHIVNLASSAGKLAPPGIATYAATKHGVVGFTEALHWEHRHSGIDFSIVMPGIVRTDMIAGYKEVRGVRDIGPEDVAAAIVGALERPRLEVFVPRSLGALWKFLIILPRGAREAVMRAMNIDKVTWEADRSARSDYEGRAAASAPRLEEPTRS